MGWEKTAGTAPDTAPVVQDEPTMDMDTLGAQEAVESAGNDQLGPDSEAVAPEEQGREPETQTDGPLEYAVTGCGYLNLREGPGLEAPIITELPRGVGVVDTGKTQGEWWQVTTGFLTGWVMGRYLEPVWS